MEPYSDMTIKIPTRLQELIRQRQLDINLIISDALKAAVQDAPVLEKYLEVPYSSEVRDQIQTTDIPSGAYMRIPELSLEEYERIANGENWEYLDGILIHHSPESNYHNAIVLFLARRAGAVLDPHQYIMRASRIALSIGDEKPEPDFMVFDRDSFYTKKRRDQTDSEIVESPPLLIVELVSESTADIDVAKVDKYRSKGVKEYWQIFIHEIPIIATVWELKLGTYESSQYTEGEIRSRVIPDFAVQFNELENPDFVTQ
jgi:Uma2 family endonuclease